MMTTGGVQRPGVPSTPSPAIAAIVDAVIACGKADGGSDNEEDDEPRCARQRSTGDNRPEGAREPDLHAEIKGPTTEREEYGLHSVTSWKDCFT